MDLLSSLFGTYWRNKQKPAGPGQTNQFAPTYGAFAPTYYANIFVKPRNNVEALQLYNHARTVAWYMDAFPFLSQSGLPVKIGLDDIISAIPVFGDIAGVVLSLYLLFIAYIFGVPNFILGRMVVNITVDGTVGIVPFIGDLLDVFFKSNLRNLELLEEWLINDAPQYQITVPPKNPFLPRLPPGGKLWEKASGEPNPREKFLNPTRSTRLKRADLD